MNIQPTTSCQFRSKNSYINLAEKALTKDDKLKLLSYHYEAKARMHYLKFLREKSNLKNLYDNNGSMIAKGFKFIKLISKMAYEKFLSWYHISDAFKLYPKRFD